MPDTKKLFCFPTNYPARIATSAAPEGFPFRIAVDGALVVAMGLPGGSLTTPLSFVDRDVAEGLLTRVRESIPEAEIVLFDPEA